jgi:hypothetical protein
MAVIPLSGSRRVLGSFLPRPRSCIPLEETVACLHGYHLKSGILPQSGVALGPVGVLSGSSSSSWLLFLALPAAARTSGSISIGIWTISRISLSERLSSSSSGIAARLPFFFFFFLFLFLFLFLLFADAVDDEASSNTALFAAAVMPASSYPRQCRYRPALVTPR